MGRTWMVQRRTTLRPHRCVFLDRLLERVTVDAATTTQRVLPALWLAAISVTAFGYVPSDRWTETASGTTGDTGTPVTLTWGVVDDETYIIDEGNSDLVSFMDDIFGETSSSSDVTTRSWFSVLESCFDRWEEVSGLTFEFEASDDGATVAYARQGPAYVYTDGILGTRADIRLSGNNIDGDYNTLAYTWLPDLGDMVIDTGETSFYNDSTDNYLALRNVVMHELGHAFGLLHVESSTESFLMEPTANLTFDGPQLDDIRGIQGLYGDAYEKTNDGQGNETYNLATSLGTLVSEASLSVGSDAVGDQVVEADETDFVSIANSGDTDVFSFTIDTPLLLDAVLTPLGGEFYQAVEGGAESYFDANSRNDLEFIIYGTDGTTVLATADDTSAGSAEEVSALELTEAGTYYVSITGSTSSVQLYELMLTAEAMFVESGDFNGDGLVDLADYVIWRNSLGLTGTDLAADANGDSVVDSLDYVVWKEQFGSSSTVGSLTSATAVPEPGSAVTLMLCGLAFVGCVANQTKKSE